MLAPACTCQHWPVNPSSSPIQFTRTRPKGRVRACAPPATSIPGTTWHTWHTSHSFAPLGTNFPSRAVYMLGPRTTCGTLPLVPSHPIRRHRLRRLPCEGHAAREARVKACSLVRAGHGDSARARCRMPTGTERLLRPLRGRLTWSAPWIPSATCLPRPAYSVAWIYSATSRAVQPSHPCYLD